MSKAKIAGVDELIQNSIASYEKEYPELVDQYKRDAKLFQDRCQALQTENLTFEEMKEIHKNLYVSIKLEELFDSSGYYWLDDNYAVAYIIRDDSLKSSTYLKQTTVYDLEKLIDKKIFDAVKEKSINNDELNFDDDLHNSLKKEVLSKYDNMSDLEQSIAKLAKATPREERTDAQQAEIDILVNFFEAHYREVKKITADINVDFRVHEAEFVHMKNRVATSRETVNSNAWRMAYLFSKINQAEAGTINESRMHEEESAYLISKLSENGIEGIIEGIEDSYRYLLISMVEVFAFQDMLSIVADTHNVVSLKTTISQYDIKKQSLIEMMKELKNSQQYANEELLTVIQKFNNLNILKRLNDANYEIQLNEYQELLQADFIKNPDIQYLERNVVFGRIDSLLKYIKNAILKQYATITGEVEFLEEYF